MIPYGIPQVESYQQEITLYTPDSPDQFSHQTCWGYYVADPYAIYVSLLSGPEEHTWLFGRDLAAGGLDSHTGMGDVQFWPNEDAPCVGMRIETEDPETRHPISMLFLVPRPSLVKFLRKTYSIVPAGGESKIIEPHLEAFIDSNRPRLR